MCMFCTAYFHQTNPTFLQTACLGGLFCTTRPLWNDLMNMFQVGPPAADLNLYYDHCAQTINIAGAFFTDTTVTLAVKSWSMSTWEPKKVASICFASVIIAYIQGFLVNDIGKFACTMYMVFIYRPITWLLYIHCTSITIWGLSTEIE